MKAVIATALHRSYIRIELNRIQHHRHGQPALETECSVLQTKYTNKIFLTPSS